MCGIIGFIGPECPNDSPDKEQLRWALRLMTIDVTTRGTDAGGYAGISRNGSVVMNKLAGPLHALNDIDDAIMECTAFIAHARLATHGDAKDNKNNHPFISRDGRFALIHNGIISNYRSLSSNNDGECDSESILRSIEVQPSSKLVKKIKKTAPKIVGAAACAMLDLQTPDSLYLFRSCGGEASPIHTVRLKNGFVLFASTWEMLYRAILLSKLKVDPSFKLSKENDDLLIVISNNGRSVNRFKLEEQAKTYYKSYNGYYNNSAWDYEDEYYGYSHHKMLAPAPSKSDTGIFIYKAANPIALEAPLYREYSLMNMLYAPRRSAIDSKHTTILSIRKETK